jgi:hypothetical protein
LRQLFFVLIIICLFSLIPGVHAQSGFTIGPSMSASWYNPDESGHGIMLDLIDEELAWLDGPPTTGRLGPQLITSR